MSKRRSPQTDTSAPPKLCVDPLNMVALRAADGSLFLVDRNCALTSERCRAYIQDIESLVLAAVAAETNRVGDSEAGSTTPVSISMATPLLGLNQRTGSGLLGTNGPGGVCFVGSALVENAGPLFTPEMLARKIPFVSLDSGSSTLVSLTAAELLVSYQTQSTSPSRQTSGDVGRCESRAGANAAAATAAVLPTSRHPSPFMSQIVTGGSRLYPVVPLSDMDAELLELGACFMHHKYRADSEPEKRTPFNPKALAGEDTARLISLSVLLDM